MISLKEDTGDVMQGRVPGLQSEPGSRVKCYKAGRHCTALNTLSRFRSTKVKGKTQDCVGTFFCFLYCNSVLQVTKEHSLYSVMIETYRQPKTNNVKPSR